MTLKEQLAEAKSALAALKERIEANDAEAIAEGEKLQADIEQKTAEIAQAEKKASLLNVIGNKEEDTDMGETKNAANLGEHFVNYLKSNDHSKRFDVVAPAFKAATDTQTSPAAAVDWATTFDRNVVTAVRTPLVIRDLFGSETISGSTLQYLVEGAIQGAPAVTAEGAEKPQIHFAENRRSILQIRPQRPWHSRRSPATSKSLMSISTTSRSWLLRSTADCCMNWVSLSRTLW